MEYYASLGEPYTTKFAPISESWNLYGCSGGTWEAGILTLASVRPGSSSGCSWSPMSYGLGTGDDCNQGFIARNYLPTLSFKSKGLKEVGTINFSEGQSLSRNRDILLQILQISPAAVAMHIPGC